MSAPSVPAARERDAVLAELDLVYATAPVGLCVLDASGRFRRINERLAEINGLPAHLHIGRHFAEVVPGVAPAFAKLHAQVLATGEPVLGIELDGETLARPGVRRSWVESLYPLRDATGTVVGVNVVVEEVTERLASERRVRAAEERLRLALEAAETGIWEADPDQGEIVWSPIDFALFGLDPSRSPPDFATFLATVVHPADRERVRDVFVRCIAEGSLDLDYRILRRRSDGAVATHWIAARGRLLVEPNGRRRMLGVNQDITERRVVTERLELLNRELDHRIRNVLTVIGAAIRLAPRDDPARMVEVLEGRIAALGRALTTVTEGKSEGLRLRALIEAEMAAFLDLEARELEAGDREMGNRAQPDRQRVRLAGPDLLLAPDAVQALSMSLHELATNATKHGALSVAPGRVSIAWRIGVGSQLHFEWVERGGPNVQAPPSRRGFGSRVIEASIGGQLGGRCDWHWDAAGLRFGASMPLERVEAAPDRTVKLHCDFAAGRTGD